MADTKKVQKQYLKPARRSPERDPPCATPELETRDCATALGCNVATLHCTDFLSR